MESQPAEPDLEREVRDLRREFARVSTRLERIERDLAATEPLVKAVHSLKIWDFTPYGVTPSDDWVAVDRTTAEHLLAALAQIDHWTPWQNRLEPRPPS
ncbi:hypothetical protein [Gordonia sp. (in: high G+C Gram-positive bacteria)]|uniref:hypothetical protein n=1 Tax=Gordonia sp. (in: high G+C Gram-positive bacteria) TaxID=84139 RepID=UPI0016BB79EC|nr:hypothetical protein [Gordonia sp. (in: high G+C Gram-positive bacteria)]NLG47948.1 hypothetical protein [Gordonia sp. (in: high G+C Gram-positive bacteria)]